jgi:formamidopyrimidine-DNA glycosylase
MPELPEVETVRRGLAQRVIGDRIESVWLGEKPQPFQSPPAQIAATLTGARIRNVRRMGKHIVVDLDRDAVAARRPRKSPASPAAAPLADQWIIHLGMTGAVQVTRPEAEILKHTHAIAELASGRQIRFVDPRRFGRMWVTSDFETCGAEPLQIGIEDFLRLFQGRATPIKSALLNQKLLRGVGNIYADESLYRAGIRPRRRAAALTRQELARLYASVREVLSEAIAAGGSSISDYFDVDGEPGLFQTQHRVYGREGKACLKCGAAIKRIVVAGRGTHYCPQCQH